MRSVSGVDMLWHNDWYDGPLEGMATFEGDEYYFRVEDEDWVDKRPRRYLLIELSEAELKLEHQVHADFERFVGTRYCPHLPPQERVQREPAKWPEFYQLHPHDSEKRGHADRPGFATFSLE